MLSFSNSAIAVRIGIHEAVVPLGHDCLPCKAWQGRTQSSGAGLAVAAMTPSALIWAVNVMDSDEIIVNAQLVFVL